jgi:hypothetical protein
MTELSWPKWAQSVAPLFQPLLSRLGGNYRVHIGRTGDERIEISLTLSRSDLVALTDIAKRFGLT